MTAPNPHDPQQQYPPQYGQQPPAQYAPAPQPQQPPVQQPYPPEQYAQPQYAPPQPGYAQGPGVYTAVFKSHTGLLFMALTSPKQVTGTMAEVRHAFWSAQAHCLTLGWFGILSALVYNWIAIFGNIGELNRVKALAKQYGES
ncbi:hypothetical protein [Gordonia sp. (in: high G+C Gram-positive bacteria)]|uniref:hypothetical protein n=1 Tax=Gordonia sp. (in: high G+C Gram-positive bacteria) TaxID=84139 RepID=UPI0039E394EF